MHDSSKMCVIIQAMRETAQHYLPFGDYHIIHGSHIRTPDPPGSEAADRAEYAKRVCHQLDARQLPKITWLTGGRTGGLMDHKVSCQSSMLVATVSCSFAGGQSLFGKYCYV